MLWLGAVLTAAAMLALAALELCAQMRCVGNYFTRYAALGLPAPAMELEAG